MRNIPKKLEKWLSEHEDKRDFHTQRFNDYVELAKKHKFQSPSFWAMRQILSEKNDETIKRNIGKRLKIKK